MRSTDVVLSGHELLSLQLRERRVRETDVVEPSHNLHRAHVGIEIKFVGHISSVKDEVEGKRIRLVPVLVSSADEVVGTKSKSIILLVRRVGDGVDLSTEGVSPKQSKVTTMRMLVNCVDISREHLRTVHQYRQYRLSCQDRIRDAQVVSKL